MKSDTKLYLCITVSLAIILFVAACEKKSADPSDSEIALRIQGKLGLDSGLQWKKVSVQSSGGVVTLSGSIDNEAQRIAAARYASSEPGVKQVVDLLSVAPAGIEPPAEPAPQRQIPAAKPRVRQTPQPKPLSVETREEEASAVPEIRAEAAPVVVSRGIFAPPSSPPPPKVTIPAGTKLTIRLIDTINSETASAGQTFEASLGSPLSVDGDIVVPAGYTVEGHVVEAKSAGRFAGQSALTVELDRLVVGSKMYNLDTDQFHQAGSWRGKDTATKVGAGAALGAILGGIAGGGKGAAIGAAAGGGVGGAVQASSRGQQIVLRSESTLNFTLQTPLVVVPTTESSSIAPRPLLQSAEGCSDKQGRKKGCREEKCEIGCEKHESEKSPVLWP